MQFNSIIALLVLAFLPDTVSGVCQDKVGECAKYMKTGWYTCWVGSYMYDYCPRTCGFCDKGPIPKPKPGCHDFEKNCGTWKKMGYCENNALFMKKYCAKMCDMCRPVPTQTLGRCSDKHQHCADWAKNGECKKNPKFMLMNCKKSCKACYPIPTRGSLCKDQHQHCADWAKNGECKKNPKFMLASCKKSCRACLLVTPTRYPGPTKHQNPCHDEDPSFCAAQKSNCFWNSAIMSKKCKLTCRMCSTLADCFDKNSYCPKWAESGKCKVGSPYRPWMLETCEFTCTHCGKVLPTTAPPPPQACADEDQAFCRQHKGDCIFNSKVMSKKCKLTCQMCSQNLKCFDQNSYCPQWKKEGSCLKKSPYHVFMMTTCPYTCTKCGTVPLPTEAPTNAPTKAPTRAPPSKCMDTDPGFCLEQKDQCFNNNDVMSTKCFKTCKMCSPSTHCFDSDSYCPKWKELGYCKKDSPYHGFMNDKCKFTCQGC
ncbi:uncharacterized protein [Clytia hemisphaerica]